MGCAMIATADQFDGKRYPTEAAMIEGMIGRIMIEGQRRGWKGFWLADFRREDPLAGALDPVNPVVTIILGPGHQASITAEDCRRFWQEQAAVARKRAYEAGPLFGDAADAQHNATRGGTA